MNNFIAIVLSLLCFSRLTQKKLTLELPNTIQRAQSDCPGGYLIPIGDRGAYYFFPDSVRVAQTVNGRPRILLKFYEEAGEASALFHVLLDLGPSIPPRQLDSLVRTMDSTGYYAGLYPFGLYTHTKVPLTGTLSRGKGLPETVAFSTSIRPGGVEMALAHRFDAAGTRALRATLDDWPHRDFILRFCLPVGRNGDDCQLYQVSIGTALENLKNFDQ